MTNDAQLFTSFKVAYLVIGAIKLTAYAHCAAPGKVRSKGEGVALTAPYHFCVKQSAYVQTCTVEDFS